MANISDDLADEFIAHSVDLSRFEVAEVLAILSLFQSLERQLIAELQRVDPTAPLSSVWQRRRTEALLTHVRKVIGDHYRTMWRTQMRDLRDLAAIEVQMTLNTVNAAVEATVFTVGVNEATLKAMLDDSLLIGAPARTWWERQSATLLQRYGDVIRQGLLRGDSIGKMVQQIRGTRAARYQDGILAKSRRDIEALVRTSVQSIAQASRMATFEANVDVVSGVQFLTSLDRSVCQICRGYSDQAWTLDKKRLPGTTLSFAAPPIHFKCRCQLIPLLRSFDRMVQEVGPVKKRALSQLDAEQRVKLNGGLAEDPSFQTWLARQSVERQRQILGPTRYRLWSTGKLSLTDMLNMSGQPLTLAELQAKRAS